MPQCQFKVVRQIGQNIFPHKKLTPKQNKLLRNKKLKKMSDFGQKLINTKKLSIFYGNLNLRKIQHNKLYTSLDKKHNLLFILETRLDVILVRAQFCTTIYSARQLIIHKKVCVNYRVVNFPSYSILSGDIISIEPGFQLELKNLQKKATPHLEINYKTRSIIMLSEPKRIYFPYKINLDLI